MSINGVSRVAVTSTVLCVLIWLLDIIILALSYSEFCKQSSDYEIDVKKKGSAFRTENKISMNHITRSCFEDAYGPFGHGMICSCFAVIASLFAISAHSESGQVRVRSTPRFRKTCYKNEYFEKPRKGACVNSKWAYGTSCLLSLICTGSSSFGAYLSILYSNRAENSQTKGGMSDTTLEYLGIELLTNEISILRSCLFIECACQGFLALMSLYNVYLCGRLVIFHSRYFIRVSQEEHAQSNSVEIDNTSANIPHRATYSLPAANNSQPLDTTNNNYADSVFLEQGPEPSLVPLNSRVGYSNFAQADRMSRTNSFGSGKNSGTAESESDSTQLVAPPARPSGAQKGESTPLRRPGNSSLRTAAGRRHRPEKSVSFRGTALVAE